MHRIIITSLLALLMLAGHAVAQQRDAAQLTVTIQGTVNSANGSIEGTFGPVTLPVTVTIPPPVQSVVTITSQTVDRPDAPAGTSRVLTVTATSSTGAALSAPLPAAPGIAFTPMAGQPAGMFKWSFVY